MVHTNPSEGESSSGARTRQRVTRACQRCRLKKCKCNGHTPCSRCKSDDAICAYPKHQHSEKIVYRKGYVQMLERQQAQLIAGIKGLHQMNQNDERLPAEPLETNKNNQPLVHQILQRLGILKTDDPWDEIEPEIGEADSQITEPDAVADPITIPECPYTWPGFSNAGNNSIPQAWKDIKHISTGLSLPGNAAPSPSAGIPFYQFLSAENLQFLKANGPLATNFADGGIPSRSWFESVAMVEPTREPFSQPHSNCLVADPSQFAYPDINQPASLSSGRRFGGENMTSQIDGATGQFFYR